MVQKGVADALAFQEAAAALLQSEALRPRIINSLRAATRGFHTVCNEHEVRHCFASGKSLSVSPRLRLGCEGVCSHPLPSAFIC